MSDRPKMYVPDYKSYYRPFRNMFDLVETADLYDVSGIDTADVLLLTGGQDIDPSYYGHKNIAGRGFDNVRDRCEWQLIKEATKQNKPIVGICRGAQWLSIAGGGKLIQHVDNHTRTHPVDTFDGQRLYTSSLHHQMCDLRKVTHKLLAWSNSLGKTYIDQTGKNIYPDGLVEEPEVFWIPKIKGFGVQGHPEMMADDAPFTTWMLEKLRYFINH